MWCWYCGGGGGGGEVKSGREKTKNVVSASPQRWARAQRRGCM